MSSDARGFSGATAIDSTAGLKRAAPMLENVTEAAAACLLTMAQGNVLAFGLGHWIVASQTGLAAGVLATAALWLSGGRGRWAVAGVLGLATAAIDYVVHPSGFGPALAEPIVTGIAAAGLSLLAATVRDRWVRSRRRAEPATD
jgi:O-antigen ligase